MTQTNLIGPLTADEWASFRLNHDGDPLYCCANTSEVRTAIFHVLRMGGEECDGIPLRVAWHIVQEHEIDHPLLRKLYDFYVAGKPELAPRSALAKILAVDMQIVTATIEHLPTWFDLSTQEGRITALGRAAPKVALVLDPHERAKATNMLAATIGLDRSLVATVVDAWRGYHELPITPAPEPTAQS